MMCDMGALHKYASSFSKLSPLNLTPLTLSSVIEPKLSRTLRGSSSLRAVACPQSSKSSRKSTKANPSRSAASSAALLMSLSYDGSFVVEDHHRPLLEQRAPLRGLGWASHLFDGIEIADQTVAVLRTPLPEVIGNDSKLSVEPSCRSN